MSRSAAEAAMAAVRPFVGERNHGEVWRRLLEALATPEDKRRALAELQAQEVPPREVALLDKSTPALRPTGAVGVLAACVGVSGWAYPMPSEGMRCGRCGYVSYTREAVVSHRCDQSAVALRDEAKRLAVLDSPGLPRIDFDNDREEKG